MVDPKKAACLVEKVCGLADTPAGGAGAMLKKMLTTATDALFTYETVAVSKVRSPTLAIIHNSIRLAILIYVVIVIFLREYGYQAIEDGKGSVQVQVRGTSFTPWSQDDSDDLGVIASRGVPLDMRVSDNWDLVQPPLEEGALFLTTNYIDTPNQVRGTCKSSSTADACTSDADCPARQPARSRTGYYNGTCSSPERAHDIPTTKACYLIAWCPAETTGQQPPDTNILPEADTFLVKTKVSIKFPFAGKVATNYHGDGDVLGYNAFHVSEILARTNTTFEDVARAGAVFELLFNWDCNLDKDIDECMPEITYSRLDDPEGGQGYSFGYVTYSSDESTGTQYRYLRKAYGLRFLIESSGRGRRFDWATILVKLGSTAALIGIATVVVDFLALYVLPKKDVYQSLKFRVADEREQEKLLKQDKQDDGAAGDAKAPGGDDAAKEPPSYGTVTPAEGAGGARYDPVKRAWFS